MQLATGYEDRRPRIEIVPLIDVVFLLLVFFIYTMLSMTVYRGLRVDLPDGSGQVEDLKTMVITLSDDNTFWVDGKEMSMTRVVEETARRISGRDDPVLVSGDRRADLGVAIELLSELRKANVSSVSFRVKRAELDL